MTQSQRPAVAVEQVRANCTDEEYALAIEGLPFRSRMAQMLVKISRDLRLAKHVLVRPSVPAGKTGLSAGARQAGTVTTGRAPCDAALPYPDLACSAWKLNVQPSNSRNHRNATRNDVGHGDGHGDGV